MPDEFYFACLGVSIASAIAVPIALKRGLDNPEKSAPMALCSGYGMALGFVSSLPFGSTRELPWFPYLSGVYFGGLALSVLFYRSFPSRGRTASYSKSDGM